MEVLTCSHKDMQSDKNTPDRLSLYSRYSTLSGVVCENIYLLEGVVLQVSRGSDEGKDIFSTSGFQLTSTPS